MLSADGRVYDPEGFHPISQYLIGRVVAVSTEDLPESVALHYEDGRTVIVTAMNEGIWVSEQKLGRA